MSRRDKCGFMLLEAAVALLVIGVVAGAALELYGAQMRVARRTPALLVAAALAQDRLAAVQLLEPEQLRRLPESLAAGKFAAPFGAYRWQTSVTRTSELDLFEARVAVLWTDGDFELVTRIHAPSAGAGRSQ